LRNIVIDLNVIGSIFVLCEFNFLDVGKKKIKMLAAQKNILLYAERFHKLNAI
jgi:hypothetical protein